MAAAVGNAGINHLSIGEDDELQHDLPLEAPPPRLLRVILVPLELGQYQGKILLDRVNF
jgi:hypothetical protein